MPKLNTPAGTADRDRRAAADCSFSEVALDQAIASSASGEWDLPDFQRGFVWKPSQVALMADSLWRNYPIGFVLLWTGSDPNRLRNRRAWIADGQQRLTALCLLFGEKPQWWERRAPSEWESMRARYDVRYDIEGGEGKSRFVVGTPLLDPGRFIPLPALLEMDPRSRDGMMALRAAAARVKALGYCREIDEEALLAQLSRVASMRSGSLMAIAVEHELREVLEIFDRLNSRGMKFRKVLLTAVRQTLSAIFGAGLMSPMMRDFHELKPR